MRSLNAKILCGLIIKWCFVMAIIKLRCKGEEVWIILCFILKKYSIRLLIGFACRNKNALNLKDVAVITKSSAFWNYL